MKHRIYSAEMIAPDGRCYSVRYLQTADELAGLQAVGLIPSNVCEVVGMQDAADQLVASLEMQSELMQGGLLQ